MTKEQIYGVWTCRKSIKKGKEKTYKKKKITITFGTDGLGRFKLLFVHLVFKWTYDDGKIVMSNPNDGRAMDSKIEIHDGCLTMEANDSISYFYKG